MKLNLQAGDLAMLTRNVSRCPCMQGLVGRVVIKVTAIAEDSVFWGPAWAYEGPFRRCGCWVGVLSTFLDADLTRLNPPKADEEAGEPRVVESGYAHA